MAKKPNQRNTKAEILTAFNDLLKQNKDLESQLKEAKKQTKFSATSADAIASSTPEIVNSTQANNSKNEVVPMTVPALIANEPQSVGDILQVLTQLQDNFGGAVSNLSEKLTQEAVTLENVQTSVSKQEDQLTNLYDLDVENTDVDQLIQDYQDSEKTFDEEFDTRQGELDEELTSAQEEWDKEQETYQRSIKERDENTAKTRQREAEEYLYDLQLDRKLSTETYEQDRKQIYQELEDIQELQNKEWDEREEAIATREKEFSELETKAESLEAELEAAIKKAKEEGKGIANHQAKVKADLREKEVFGLKRSYELRLDFLEDTIQDQDDRIDNLSKQLDAALKQVQDLAVKAIEGAAESSSFEALREIALEQARTTNKGK
ncbi:MAG: hypothetical protein F6K29_33645 [Okeania sp. SIO2G5]|nr:hypothetical protein [Okeania sp. SIO2G5]